MVKKEQITTLVVIIIVIGLIGWAASQMPKIPSEGTPAEEKQVEEAFSLSAIVSSVDVGSNFLIVKPTNQEKEIKVVLSETTRLIKLEFPFDPKNPPKEGTFTPTQTEVEISDFQAGDNVFIKAKENIAGKTEFNSVDFVHILP